MGKLRLNLLGNLTLIAENQKVDCTEVLGKQISAIFSYLVVNRDVMITKEKLIEIFWADSKNPLNALKFAIHRMRKCLEEFPVDHAEEWILTQKGGYSFSCPSMQVDIFQLEEFSQNPSNLSQADKILAMYQGSFLANLDSDWIYTQREYYWQSYIRAVQSSCEAYVKDGQLDLAEGILYKALSFDTYHDQLNYLYLKLLLDEKKYAMAMKHYEKISASFYKEFGMEFQGKAQSLIYFVSAEQDEMKVTSAEYLTDLTLKADNSAFFCERAIFQKLVLAKTLESKRSQDKFVLVMLSIKINSPVLEKEVCGDFLNQVVKNSLRANDIFTRLSKIQFAMLLTIRKMDDLFPVMDRLVKKYYKKYPAIDNKLFYDYQLLGAIKPAEIKN